MAKKPKIDQPSKRIVLLEDGPRRVVCAQSASGKSLAKDYLDHLDRNDQRKFAARFERLRDGMILRSPDHMRNLRRVTLEIEVGGQKQRVIKAIWEVKIDGDRMLTFQDGDDWVLTNGSPKINKKAFSGEIDTAERVMADYLGR